jgi:hypothetical protein
MEKTNVEATTKVAPKGDSRRRVSKAVRLWVMNRSWSKDRTHIEMCGVIESIERCVYIIEGKPGCWVRYSNRYYPLHTVEEFSGLIEMSKNENFNFFNNEIKNFDEDSFKQTNYAPFIYWDEADQVV